MVSERRPGKGKKEEHMKYSNFRLSKKDEKKYVVIIGCGRLGASLAAEIYGQGNDVCIADRDRDAFRKLDSSYGGLTETAMPRIWKPYPVHRRKRPTALFW